MSDIVWKSEYSVGFAPIDEQHKRLFGLFGELMDVIHEGAANERVDKVFIQLKGYVINHFRFEERVMRSAGYPLLDDHEDRHDKVKESLCEHRANFNKARDVETRDAVVNEVVKFLTDWLTGHILVEDMKYIPYLDNAKVDKIVAKYAHDQ